MTGRRSKMRTHATSPTYNRHRRDAEQREARAEKIARRRAGKDHEMGEHKIPKESASPLDAIDAAVDAAEAKTEAEANAEFRKLRAARYPDHLFADYVLADGRPLCIIVPNDFDSDQFETAVAVLIQLRAAVGERQRAEANKGLVVPNRPHLVRADGRRLT